MHQKLKKILMGIKRFLPTLRARILFVTVSLVLGASIVISLISYNVISSNLQQNMIGASETRLSFLCSSIDSNIENVTSFTYSCQINRKIAEFALKGSDIGNIAKREAHDAISEAYTSNPSLSSRIIRIVVISKNGDDFIQILRTLYSSADVSTERILSLPYFDRMHEAPGRLVTPVHDDPFIRSKHIPMIPFLRVIQHPYAAEETGYIFAEMSTSAITDSVRSYPTEPGNVLMLTICGDSYLCENGSLTPYSPEHEVVRDLSGEALTDGTIIQQIRWTDSGKTALMISKPLATDGWYVTEYLDESNLERDIRHTFLISTFIILGSCGIIGFTISMFLHRTVNTPVKILQDRMERIEQGDFSRDPSTEWRHELGDIGKSINDLSENVLSLMNQRIEDENQKRDLEYRMLQSQINPHFLYNTLNTIKWMAITQNAPGIAEMTTSLSHLMKDVSKNTANLITIDSELSLLRDYFTIMQYRYGGTISMDFNIEDDALLSRLILRFTLQPIVENAIFHGIEPKGMAGIIDIHIYRDEASNVRIDVTDNGVGIPPELASRLLEEDSSAKSSFFKEIGISNVHKRLQYEFGEDYGLSVDSKVNEYTTISVLLPDRMETP